MISLADDRLTLLCFVVACGGIAVLLIGWWRVRNAAADSERIRLITSRYLGPKKTLTLVDVEGERLLLALCGNSIQLIARLSGGGRPNKARDEPIMGRSLRGLDRAEAAVEELL